MKKEVCIYEISELTDARLELLAYEIIEANKKGEEIKIKGANNYSKLLTETVLLKYFDEFKNNPWQSYRKYFKSPNNVYPLIAIVDLIHCRDINKQSYIRNDLLMDALLKGVTPTQLNMMTYDSLVPYSVEKKQRPISRKYLK